MDHQGFQRWVRILSGVLPFICLFMYLAYPEPQLLAYVFGKFKDNGLLGIKTEAEKMLMLAALNLVECIAETAPQRSKCNRRMVGPCVGGKAIRAAVYERCPEAPSEP